MSVVYCNGKFSQADLATFLLNDRGLLLGDGFFDTMVLHKGGISFVDYHWQRITHTAKILQITLPLAQSELIETAYRLAQQNNIMDKPAGLRLTITRGNGQRGLLPTGHEQPNYGIQVFAISPSPSALRVATTTIRRNETSPLSTIKSINYLETILAKQQAIAQGADDVLWLNCQGHVCETSVANIFLINEHEIITPPISDGVLPGVTRRVILELCETLNIDVAQRSIELSECYRAQAAFVTNSLLPMQLVSQIDEYRLPQTVPKVVHTLTQHYQARRDTSLSL
jgi:branched-chain amino acid aminotransferase